MQKLPTVLLVAGDRLTGLLTKSGLEMYGYDVRGAATPREGLELLASASGGERFGVFVIDVDLRGDPDGLTAAKLARNLDPKILVIYTSRSPQHVPDRLKVSGAPILRTPYHAQQVSGIIRELQQGPGAGQQSHKAA